MQNSEEKHTESAGETNLIQGFEQDETDRECF